MTVESDLFIEIISFFIEQRMTVESDLPYSIYI